MPLLGYPSTANYNNLDTDELNRVKKRMNKTETAQEDNFQLSTAPTKSQVTQVYQNLLVILQKLSLKSRQILDHNLPVKDLLKLFIEGGTNLIDDTNYIVNNVLTIYNYFSPQQELYIKRLFSELRNTPTQLLGEGSDVLDEIENGVPDDLEELLIENDITQQEYSAYGNSILDFGNQMKELIDTVTPYIQQYNYMRLNARPANLPLADTPVQGGHLFRSSNDPRIYPELRFL
jgi:hypothetical protein